jgi:hypothetical protein
MVTQLEGLDISGFGWATTRGLLNAAGIVFKSMSDK